MTMQAIKKQALKLDLKSRANLAHALLKSLDDVSEEENIKLWAKEAWRRNEEIEKGNLKEKPASEVYKKIRARYK
ncbi:MAG: addiction module protein [Bacteroidetes bacterium]|nr:addiction module protein [Bacteroidota bacterium]